MAVNVMPLLRRKHFLKLLSDITLYHNKGNCRRIPIICIRNRSTESTSGEYMQQEVITETELDPEVVAKRDVSRLPKHLRDQMDHVLQVPSEETEGYQQTRDYQRMLYAKYGKASGVSPSIMWPSKAELAEIIEDEKEWEPTLQERWLELAAKKKEKEDELRQRLEHVEKQMAKMPQYIEQFRAKIHKAEEEEKKAEEKRQLLVEEAREYFGYYIDVHDPRFEQMKLEKEEKEKMERKLAKRAQKEAKVQKHLMSLKMQAAKEKAEADSKPDSKLEETGEQEKQAQSAS